MQGRNEVRWRPGQEESLAPPCSKLRSFGSKCSVWKKVLVTLLGLFGALRSDLAPPYWLISASGELRPPLCLCVRLLYSRNKLTLRHKIEPTWSSIKIQWFFCYFTQTFCHKKLKRYKLTCRTAGWGTRSEKGWKTCSSQWKYFSLVRTHCSAYIIKSLLAANCMCSWAGLTREGYGRYIVPGHERYWGSGRWKYAG